MITSSLRKRINETLQIQWHKVFYLNLVCIQVAFVRVEHTLYKLVDLQSVPYISKCRVVLYSFGLITVIMIQLKELFSTERKNSINGLIVQRMTGGINTMQDNTKKITYGAMMIALFAILLAISLYAPLIGNISMLFIPLPIILYRLKHDRASAIFVTATGVVISLLIGGILIVPVAITFGLIGFIIGDTIQSGKSKLYTFMATGLTLLLTLIATYAVAVLVFNFNAMKVLLEGIKEMQETMRTMMEKYGSLPANYDETIAATLTYYEHVIPSTFILAVYLMTFILLTLNLSVVNRLGHRVQKFPPFREMKLPVFIVILYGVILLLQFTMKMEVGSTFYLMHVNATVILRSLFLLQGISFVLYYLHEMKVPKMVTVFGAVFAVLLSPLTTLLGILDAGTNIRGWIGKDKSE